MSNSIRRIFPQRGLNIKMWQFHEMCSFFSKEFLVRRSADSQVLILTRELQAKISIIHINLMQMYKFHIIRHIYEDFLRDSALFLSYRFTRIGTITKGIRFVVIVSFLRNNHISYHPQWTHPNESASSDSSKIVTRRHTVSWMFRFTHNYLISGDNFINLILVHFELNSRSKNIIR